MIALTETTFGGLQIVYDARVLAPRPWTMLQSEWASELSESLPDGPMLELCAGVGHIGLAAAAGSDRDLVQVESDATAAQFARENAERAGVEVEVRQAELTAALASDERFALIIADPPYVPTDDVDQYPDDPPAAIDGGPLGLDVSRVCLQIAERHLVAGGALLLQTRGERQAYQLADLLDDVAPSLELREISSFDCQRAVACFVRTKV